MYEGRLTTARDEIATAGIERSGIWVSASSRFRKLTREKANCDTASPELVLYGRVSSGAQSDSVRSVKNETAAIATEACKLRLNVWCARIEMRYVDRSV